MPAVQTAGTSDMSFALRQERRTDIACPASLPGRKPFSEHIRWLRFASPPATIRRAFGTGRRCQTDRPNIFRVPSVGNSCIAFMPIHDSESAFDTIESNPLPRVPRQTRPQVFARCALFVDVPVHFPTPAPEFPSMFRDSRMSPNPIWLPQFPAPGSRAN